MTEGARSHRVHGRRDDHDACHDDWLAEERPVALIFNGISHAVMMATPADLEDFARGFAFTEGLVLDPVELLGIDVGAASEGPMPSGGQGGIEVHLEVTAACEWRLKARRRTLAGRTGCGLCGTDSLDQVHRHLPRAPVVQLSPSALRRAQEGLRSHQGLQRLTGATHAAAWCTPDGDIALVREDVGRHNALDKLAGALIRTASAVDPGFVLITSRASFEMVQKAAMLGAGALAAISAPTSLAVHTAQQANLALAGFVRGADLVAYTFPERFGLTAPSAAAAPAP